MKTTKQKSQSKLKSKASPDASTVTVLTADRIRPNKGEIKTSSTCLVIFTIPKKSGENTSPTTNLLSKEHKSTIDALSPALKDGTASGKVKECLFFRELGHLEHRHALLVGLGSNPTSEDMRKVGAAVYKTLSSGKIENASILVDGVNFKPDFLSAFVQGIHLASYKFDELKSAKKTENESMTLTLVGKKMTDKANEKILSEAAILGEAVNFSRRLGDLPGNLMTPTILADSAAEAAKKAGIKVTVWDKKKCETERMGGLLGVSRGSVEEPRFIILEYTGAAKTVKPLVFVGKGLTFDCGGISIKPSAAMEEMKYDMCGGANVIGAILAIAKLKLKVNVTCLVASTENLASGSATKPGDVHTARNGKTFEVNNTDAEGRLILADALSYGSELKPQMMLDAATLTGAMVVALGNLHTGFFTRDEKLAARVRKSADASGELAWQMPLVDDHVEDMKGNYADLSNISSSKGAGSSTAAGFLEQFVEKDIPWVHFDIAGTGWAVGGRLNYCTAKGASGAMLRTFVEIARSFEK